MSEKRFRIVTFGKLVNGFDKEVVATNLTQLCKFGPDTLARLLSGEKFVLKTDLDGQTAKRYLAALAQTGIVCRAEQLQPVKSEAIGLVDKSHPAPAQKKPAPRITCPKCNTEQDDGLCCVHCQIVMKKYTPEPSPQRHSEPVASIAPVAEEKSGFPFAKIVMLLLVLGGIGAWCVIANPFASAKGTLNVKTSNYVNTHFGFALSFPNNWNSYTVDEAIACATINREYADEYLLLISPTDPKHCMMVVNIAGTSLEYFKSKGWDYMVKSTGKRHPVSYESVDQINGLKVYRVGYDIANSYREDAYFNANGTLIQIYFYTKKSFDTEKQVTMMRALLDEKLRAI